MTKQKTLDSISLERMELAQQAALMRLQLYFTGRTHEILNGFADQARAILARHAKGDGTLDGLGLNQALSELDAAWKKAFEQWKQLFQAGQREAACIPFGVLAAQHNRLIAPSAVVKTEAQKADPGKKEYDTDYVFSPQLERLLEAARRRVYQDGIPLSSRIWKTGQWATDGIQRLIYTGVADGRSAWDIAKDLEAFLGSGQNCPRWTSTRLYKLTKTDIASGDRRGLLSGEECDGRGVAYKALRLARNEIQVAHHLTTDTLMAQKPWIEQEKINLSPSHGKEDECDEAAEGGENGDGVYPKGTILLPLHVQCLCFKTAVQMAAEAFVNDLRGWMKGETAWPAMDAYAQMIGGQANMAALMTGNIVAAFEEWLFGDEKSLDKRMSWGRLDDDSEA